MSVCIRSKTEWPQEGRPSPETELFSECARPGRKIDSNGYITCSWGCRYSSPIELMRILLSSQQTMAGQTHSVRSGAPSPEGSFAEQSEMNDKQGSGGSDIASPSPLEPPNGGLKAWACVAGSFLLQFCSFGYVNA